MNASWRVLQQQEQQMITSVEEEEVVNEKGWYVRKGIKHGGWVRNGITGEQHDELLNCWVIEFVAKRKLRVTKYRGKNNNNNHDNDHNQMVTHAAWIMVVQSVKNVLASGK